MSQLLSQGKKQMAKSEAITRSKLYLVINKSSRRHRDPELEVLLKHFERIINSTKTEDN